MPTYRVKHNFVGPFPRGHVFNPATDYIGSDGKPVELDVDRLLSLGAIEVTTDKPSGPPPLGPETTRRPVRGQRLGMAENASSASEGSEGAAGGAPPAGDADNASDASDTASESASDASEESDTPSGDMTAARRHNRRR
jgi:hypothetical protein